MKDIVVFVQAVGSQLEGISRPQNRKVMAVFVGVLPLPLASEARAFSKIGYVPGMIDAGARHEIFP